MVNKLNVVMKYNRTKPVWVCPDCDTENELTSENCFTCDHKKPSSARIITPESERQETEEYISIINTPHSGASSVPTPTYGTPISPPIHYPSTYTPKKSSAGAVIAVIIILLVVFGIIGFAVAYSQGSINLSTFDTQSYSEILTEYTTTV